MSTEMKSFAVNAAAVVECEDLSEAVRNLARFILDREYMTIGIYLANASTEDMEYMTRLVEVTLEEDGPEAYDQASEEVVLATMMLVSAEGIFPETMEELAKYTGAFKMMVAGAGLARKGLIQAFYNKMSFGVDAGNEIVFKRID